MVKASIRKVHTIKFKANTNGNDIKEGECGKPGKCMVRVAVERKLRILDPSMPNHHTRVDAGHIRFNYRGHRYSADTHRNARAALFEFDKEEKARAKAKREKREFVSAIQPFDFVVLATRGAKLEKTTRQRKDNINAARKRRQAAGQKPKKYTLHKRVVGYA